MFDTTADCQFCQKCRTKLQISTFVRRIFSDQTADRHFCQKKNSDKTADRHFCQKKNSDKTADRHFCQKHFSGKTADRHFCQKFRKHEIPEISMTKSRINQWKKSNMWLRCCDVLGNSLILRWQLPCTTSLCAMFFRGSIGLRPQKKLSASFSA